MKANEFKLKISRRSARGQAMLIVTLCVFILIAIVGLAVDGGLAFAERRAAQNASDAAALAGTRKMLQLYEAMLNNSPANLDGTALDENQIRNEIDFHGNANGLLDQAEAYFVNAAGETVSVALAVDPNSGQPLCGTTAGLAPCQVGHNGRVPWSLGAVGIRVKGTGETETFFMSILGFDTLTTSASAAAYMGVATSTSPAVWPVGVFSNTNSVDNLLGELTGNRTYVLLQGDSRFNLGNWGNLSFNGTNNPNVREGWIECGYNPALREMAHWNAFCPDQASGGWQTWGPTKYYADNGGQPASNYQLEFDLRAGSGSDGWWLEGSLGSARDNCQDLANLVNDLEVGRAYLVPVIDKYIGSPGNNSNSKFHLARLEWFRITRAEVDCHVPNDPYNPLAGEHQTWVIIGQFIYKYQAGAAGHQGSLRNSSRHTVYLGP